jgi:hypothetical protein
MNKITSFFLKLYAGLTPPCNQILLLLSKHYDASLTIRESIMVKVHLWQCHGCSRADKQFQIISQLTRQHFHQHGEFQQALSEEDKAGIKQVLGKGNNNL